MQTTLSAASLRNDAYACAFSLALVMVLAPHIAGAQPYPVIHVSALAQRADRARVEAGGVFHVTIHVRIAQRRDRLDDLILGTFENCEIISNETERSTSGDGTDFTERLTVQALAPGTATISPAYIDAVDPAIGKPMRFSSNALRVDVTGPVQPDPLESAIDRAQTVPHLVRVMLERASAVLAVVLTAVAGGYVLKTILVRRRRPRQVGPLDAMPTPAPIPTDPGGRLRTAADHFRLERSPATVEELRAALHECAGAPSGATLADALRRLTPADESLRRALIAAETVMFGSASEREAADTALLAAVDARIASTP